MECNISSHYSFPVPQSLRSFLSHLEFYTKYFDVGFLGDVTERNTIIIFNNLKLWIKKRKIADSARLKWQCQQMVGI